MINDKTFLILLPFCCIIFNFFGFFPQADSSLVARCPQYFQVPHPETTVSRGRQECLLLRSTDILFFMFCSLKFYHMLIPQPVIGKIIGWAYWRRQVMNQPEWTHEERGYLYQRRSYSEKHTGGSRWMLWHVVVSVLPATWIIKCESKRNIFRHVGTQEICFLHSLSKREQLLECIF